jgi:hypothetical protein
MSKNLVKRVTVIERNADGTSTSVVYKAKGKKKRKVSRGLKGVEKLERRFLEAGNTFTSELLSRHNRSTRKRRDGFLRDGHANLVKSQLKAVKKLTRG